LGDRLGGAGWWDIGAAEPHLGMMAFLSFKFLAFGLSLTAADVVLVLMVSPVTFYKVIEQPVRQQANMHLQV